MKFFPESTIQQLEFSKIQDLLNEYCKNDFAKKEWLI
jgi:hypothetical protein